MDEFGVYWKFEVNPAKRGFYRKANDGPKFIHIYNMDAPWLQLEEKSKWKVCWVDDRSWVWFDEHLELSLNLQTKYLPNENGTYETHVS